MGVVLALCALPLIACGEPLPASLRACAAEPDSNRRLVCYDREVARFAATATSVDSKPGPVARVGHAPAADNEREITATRDFAAASSAGARPAAENSAVAGPAVPPPATAGSGRQGAQKEPKHLTARIVSIKSGVLHLDNGQVWEEVQDESVDMNLRVGDTVTIDRVLGDYWLGGRSDGTVKVRRKEQSPRVSGE